MTATAVEWLTTLMFKKTLQAFVEGKRRCLHEGGTSSSKTWSVLQSLIYIAQEAKNPLLISVVSESLPHLKRGCIRDFFNILGESQDNNPYYNKSECMYSHPPWLGRIEFFGADDAGKVRGPRRDILFINEGNNVPWETARGLDIRTELFTVVDWNPVSEFWAHEFWIGQPENAYVHSTYQDAKHVLPAQKVADIEAYRGKDPNWWNVYGLGRLGRIEGLVHPMFEQVDSLPDGDSFFGLDFGFSNDPAVLTKHVIIGDKLYSHEMVYERGLTNDAICRKMDLLGVRRNYDEILADASEPKSIEEIHTKGYDIKACEKGPGSVEYGIQKVNQFYQYWTKESTNCIKEQRNYRYITDKDGHITDKATHLWSHGMDSRRYAVATHRDGVGEYQSVSKYGGSRGVRVLRGGRG